MKSVRGSDAQRFATIFFSMVLMVSFSTITFGQSEAVKSSDLSASRPMAVVPRLVNFAGKAVDAQAKAISGTLGVTFSIYKDQYQGAPLWIETQNVSADGKGNFAAQLGATKPEGLPLDLFISGEARWLGVRVNGGEEQPRVLLLSVPYALKAADAQTLAGLPASAFMLAGTMAPPSNPTAEISLAPAAIPAVSGTGTTDFLPLWTNSTGALGNSVLFQSGTGATAKIGINTTAPAATLDVNGGENVHGILNLMSTGTATATAGKNSQPQDFTASVFNKSTAKAVAQKFQLQSEPANNNSTTASGTLNLLYGSGTAAPAETGFKINNKGIVIFAHGQTFPGTGSGTVTSVALSAPSSDFTVSGSPVTSTGSLGLKWTVAPTSNNTANAIVKRDAFGGFLSTSATVQALFATQVTSSTTSTTAAAVIGTGFIGVMGNSSVTDGAGVSGIASGSAANGVYGSNPSHTGVYGDGSVGVWGHSSANVGVFGASFGNSGGADGVHGETTSAGGSGTAGVNQSGSASGVGVFGAGGIGVHGESGSDGGSGVEAFNFAGGDGIFAFGASGFAGFFDGNVDVNGTLSKAAGSFKINHPIDPANKYLYHSFVESSDMMNIYNGNVRTDADGNAIVSLPDWFEPLNRDFRYQLTVLGQFAQAIISSEVAGGKFVIKTDKPNVKVSWQVTGIRQDAWANAHRIPVEVAKTEKERGFYLHPELFGASEEKGIAWHRHPETMKRAKADRVKLSTGAAMRAQPKP